MSSHRILLALWYVNLQNVRNSAAALLLLLERGRAGGGLSRGTDPERGRRLQRVAGPAPHYSGHRLHAGQVDRAGPRSSSGMTWPREPAGSPGSRSPGHTPSAASPRRPRAEPWLDRPGRDQENATRNFGDWGGLERPPVRNPPISFPRDGREGRSRRKEAGALGIERPSIHRRSEPRTEDAWRPTGRARAEPERRAKGPWDSRGCFPFRLSETNAGMEYLSWVRWVPHRL